MHRIVRQAILIGIISLTLAALAPAFGAGWPASLEVGGFRITGITGTMKSDGTGTATGQLTLPGDGSCKVDLKQSGSGAVTGSTRANFTIGGVRVEGSFLLGDSGLRGTGTIRTGGKPILDANITIDPSGSAEGSGRVDLSPGFSVDAQCELAPNRVDVTGSRSRQASADTPLAVYTFKGEVNLSAAGTSIKTSANGTVERKGKIGDAVDEFGPFTFDVNPSTGQARLNVGGADITIKLW